MWLLFICCQFASSLVNWQRKWKLQMALIARLQHPYIVEFKEAWVEKVGSSGTCSCICLLFGSILCYLNAWVLIGLLCLHCDGILWRWRYVSAMCLFELAILLLLWWLFLSNYVPLWQGWIDEKSEWDILPRGGCYNFSVPSLHVSRKQFGNMC